MGQNVKKTVAQICPQLTIIVHNNTAILTTYIVFTYYTRFVLNKTKNYSAT